MERRSACSKGTSAYMSAYTQNERHGHGYQRMRTQRHVEWCLRARARALARFVFSCGAWDAGGIVVINTCNPSNFMKCAFFRTWVRPHLLQELDSLIVIADSDIPRVAFLGYEPSFFSHALMACPKKRKFQKKKKERKEEEKRERERKKKKLEKRGNGWCCNTSTWSATTWDRPPIARKHAHMFGDTVAQLILSSKNPTSAVRFDHSQSHLSHTHSQYK